MSAVVKGDEEREAERNKIMNRADCQWALDQCNWWKERKGCVQGCQCDWCKTAATFESMLKGNSMVFYEEDKRKKENG